MVFVFYACLILALASLPVLMIARNLELFDVPDATSRSATPPISVLIPARNEAAGIAQTVESVLANDYPEFEILVLDDHSEDETAEIVAKISSKDARARLERSAPLPADWNGKQHACWQLANLARHDVLLFLDADVRLHQDALATCASRFGKSDLDLLSGFPKQEMLTWSEKWLIPIMYYLLLAYLPLDRMRQSTQPEFGAGCGQLFLARRKSYFDCKGHLAIKASRHDGLRLPRSFRKAGFATDLFDASGIARVRMYSGCREVVNGLLKNATEGIANNKLIFVFTGLLLGGSLLPLLSFAHAIFYGWPSQDKARLIATVMLGIATALSFVGRGLIARRLTHGLSSVLFHPISIAWFVGLQWYAFIASVVGMKQVTWRGRA